jgi:type IV secretion system protein VirD4
MRTPKNRRGDRSSVLIVGPTRCGKSAQTISSILTTDTPAIIMSPKTDLLIPTIRRRMMLGDVRVFDPSQLLDVPDAHRASWSPLRRCTTLSGAMDAARAIVEATPREKRAADFWDEMAPLLLWPMMYAAAQAQLPMATVAQWMDRQDRPTATDEGAVSVILDRMMTSGDRALREAAAATLTALKGKWELAENTRSSIYATAMPLVKSWIDPLLAAATATCNIDLQWLLDPTPLEHDQTRPRANTLYITERDYRFREHGVVFGSLIKDLVDQQLEFSNRAGRPPRDLVLIMDEAGNTPVRWLPEIASICAGHGIQLVTVWQSVAQIHTLYGDRTGTVLANHGTKVLFSGISDEETIKYTSAVSGEAELVQTSVSSDRSMWAPNRQSIQESTRTTPLVAGWLLRQIPIGEALLVHGTLPPAHLRTTPWYADKGLVHLAQTGLPPKHGPWRTLYAPKTPPTLATGWVPEVEIQPPTRRFNNKRTRQDKNHIIRTPSNDSV